MKTYVQIGANIGNDDFQKLIERINEKVRVLLFEPNINLIDELNKNYASLKKKHHVQIFQYPISPKTEIVSFYFRDDIIEFGGSSLINRKSYKLDKVINITGKTFNDVCDEFLINEIEYLSIDTEGLDYEILNSIDLEKLKINTIVCEKWNHIDDDINGKFRTGNKFLNETIKPKYNKYNWSETTMGGQPTIIMTIK